MKEEKKNLIIVALYAVYLMGMCMLYNKFLTRHNDEKLEIPNPLRGWDEL